MPTLEYADQFFALLTAGLGMAAAGMANLFRPGLSGRGRVAATMFVGAAVGTAAYTWAPPLAGPAVGVYATGAVPCLLVGSRRAAAVGEAVLRVVRRPAVCWGLLAAAGLAVAVGAAVRFEATDREAIAAATLELDLIFTPPPLAAADGTGARTDRGAPVGLRRPTDPRSTGDLEETQDRFLRESRLRDEVVRRGPLGDDTNCHGWVFTGGRFWLPSDQVEAILAGNGYAPVADPRPGDLVIYRGKEGEVWHTGVVRYVAPGQPVLVEGKWGWMGVFLHPVDKSAYGTAYTYYRSPRTGHLLTGLTDPEPKGREKTPMAAAADEEPRGD